MGVATSTFFLMLDLGVGFGPVALGLAIPHLGYTGMFGILAALAALGIGLYFLVHGRRRSGARGRRLTAPRERLGRMPVPVRVRAPRRPLACPADRLASDLRQNGKIARFARDRTDSTWKCAGNPTMMRQVIHATE